VPVEVAPLSLLPAPSTNGVDGLYYQLVIIHAMTMVQLTECAYWCWVDPTSSPVQTRSSWQKPSTELTVTRMASPPAGLPTQGLPWQQGQRAGPEACRQASQGGVDTQPK
jgi:hypothetical protein